MGLEGFFCIEQKQDLVRLLNSPQKWLLEDLVKFLHILSVHFCNSFMCFEGFCIKKKQDFSTLLNSPQKWLLAFRSSDIPQIVFWCNKRLLQGAFQMMLLCVWLYQELSFVAFKDLMNFIQVIVYWPLYCCY
jgi:hypothetical protein